MTQFVELQCKNLIELLLSEPSNTHIMASFTEKIKVNLPSVLLSCCIHHASTILALFTFRPVDITIYTRKSVCEFLVLKISQRTRENAECVATSFQMLSCTDTTESQFLQNAYLAKMPSYIKTT